MKISYFTIIFFCQVSLLACSKNDCIEKEVLICDPTKELNPVCGCNDKNYTNPSTAECSGITDYTFGVCK